MSNLIFTGGDREYLIVHVQLLCVVAKSRDVIIFITTSLRSLVPRLYALALDQKEVWPGDEARLRHYGTIFVSLLRGYNIWCSSSTSIASEAR